MSGIRPHLRATARHRAVAARGWAGAARVVTALAVLVGLLACAPTPTEEGELPPPPAADGEDADDREAPDDGDDGDDRAVDGSVAPGGTAGPPPPPLHPAIDDLPVATVVLEQDGDIVEVAVRVAADDASRRRGLMEVEDLPDGAGMLFLFARERTGGFWMWNTLVPLDIAFAGADGVVHTVATMVPCEAEEPAGCPITAPDAPYVTALEVPAGWFAQAGLGPGAQLSWSELVPASP